MNKEIASRLDTSVRNVEKIRQSVVQQNRHQQPHRAWCDLPWNMVWWTEYGLDQHDLARYRNAP